MTTRKFATKGWALCFALALTARILNAQFTSGLEGTIFDPSGSAVPNATATIKSVSTGVEHKTVSSSAGIYRFTALPAGTFTLTVKASGFETNVLSPIEIQVAETRTLDVTLKMGTTATMIDVSATPTAVNLASGAVSGVVNETKVHELPLVGRNMYSLVVLAPGVTGLPSGGGQAYAQATADIFNPEFGVNLNANGQRAESNNFQVDSASVNSTPRGGVANLVPSADSIQEVRILSNNFSAEYGRNASAAVEVVTRSGTNRFHGTLSEFHTNNAITARNTFQASVPVFRRNEYAWTFGGPIRRDKDFAFGSMDVLRSGVGLGFPSTIATPQFVNFLKANKPNNISTLLLTEFPTSFQPNRDFKTAGQMSGADCSRLPSPSDPISSDVGTIPCNLPITGTGNFSSTVFRNGVQWSGRVDHNWHDFKDRLYGSFYRTTRQTVAFAVPSVYFPAFSPSEPDYTHLLNLNWTHTLSSIAVNQATFGYTRAFGDDTCDHCEVPQINVTGMAGPGDGFLGLFKQNNYEWKDVATVTRGTHNFKFGGRVERTQQETYFTNNFFRPTFSFASVFDFANDKPFQESNIGFDPRTGSQRANIDFANRTTALGAFLQDDWKVKPNLTLNLGLRWETFGGPTERHGKDTNVFFQGGNDFFSRIASAKVDFVPQMWQTRLDQFAPRFGFSWDPTHRGKLAIRGGVGLFYDRPGNQLFAGNRSNTPLFATTTASILTPPFLPVYGLGSTASPPYGFPPVPSIQPGLDPKNGLIRGKANLEITDPNLQTQYAENWSLGFQYGIARDWVAEGNYLGSVGHRLYSDYNVNRFSGDLIQNKGALARLNTSFGTVNYGQANYNSAYNGGTLSVRNRGFTRGLNLQAAYTFGKAIDQSNTFGINPVDVTSTRRQRGLSDFDVRQRLSFSTLWQLPRVSSNLRIANILLNGWQVSNITILQSGTPFSVFCGLPFRAVFDLPASDPNRRVIGNSGCDYNADGTNNDVPLTPSFGNSLSGLSKSDFLNGIFNCSPSVPNCGSIFPAPPLGQEGDLGRNTFFGPGYVNTDFSAIKRTHIPWFVGREGAQIEIRGELFNVFNRVNLSSVAGDLSNSLFGKATGTFPARNIQFGLRVEF